MMSQDLVGLAVTTQFQGPLLLLSKWLLSCQRTNFRQKLPNIPSGKQKLYTFAV